MTQKPVLGAGVWRGDEGRLVVPGAADQLLAADRASGDISIKEVDFLSGAAIF